MTNYIVGQALWFLGDFERTIDLYMHRNPVQLSRARPTEIDVPRAIDSSFTPEITKKRQRD